MLEDGKGEITLQERAISLLGVIERFNDSTAKLESRHTELLNEVAELQEQLRRKDEEVKRSERLAMLGETAAGLAHEIRNPLGAINLFVSMLRRDLRDRPESLELLDQVDRSIRSLDGVVSNVLHFAQNKRLNVSPVNIHSIVQELQQHFISLYSPQCQFDVRLAGNPFMKVDEQGVRQCIYNIILNALQAVSFAGVISITVENAVGRDGVSITIADDGPGIPEPIMGRLFEPFTSGRREGTGLGLSIVRRIVEAHGGQVSARNTPSAEFSIFMPRLGASAA
ncbi:MAG: two-component system sensor histidine kinase NtrB [Pseudomonadota bacterium]|jgi:signal transduction histidine kinase